MWAHLTREVPLNMNPIFAYCRSGASLMPIMRSFPVRVTATDISPTSLLQVGFGFYWVVYTVHKCLYSSFLGLCSCSPLLRYSTLLVLTWSLSPHSAILMCFYTHVLLYSLTSILISQYSCTSILIPQYPCTLYSFRNTHSQYPCTSLPMYFYTHSAITMYFYRY